jgi:hypothetical protein
MPGREQMAQRPPVGAEPPRIAPLPDAGWPDDGARPDLRSESFDHAEPQMPEPPPRPARPAFADEMRRPVPPIPRDRGDRGDPLAGFAPEPLGGRPEPRPELRPEPMPSRVTSRSEPVMPRPPREAPKPPPMRAPERAAAPPPPPIPPPPAQSADQNLAEMAQRLEAALRRPAGEAAEPRVGAPPVAPEPPPSRPAPRNEQSMAPPVAPPSPKTGFENLEDEMASLLGRPKTPS